jgi:EAL and modified HD-GYP domain-containing signal transduction protein
LIDALADFGLETVVGRIPAFVNITREFVVGELPLPLPPEMVVLELLENIEPDAEVVRGLRRLRKRGFHIAIDDYTGSRPGYDAVLACGSIVKVDCFGRSVDEVAEILQSLKAHRVKLLAEKVERHEEFRAYLDLGFELFQGYFFARPNLLERRAASANRANILRLLAELQDLDRTAEDLEQIIVRDPALSLKLVRYLNSARIGLERRIDSLREVVIYLGTETVRNIACLLMLSRVDDKPRQLMITAMMRARMCEELARSTGRSSPHAAFMVGLFSTLDAMLDRQMPDVLAELPLSEQVSRALLDHQGPLGEDLETVLAHEVADWTKITANAVELQKAYFSAMEWVRIVEIELTSPV